MYPMVYLLRNHTEFWKAAQEHVDYVLTAFNVEIRLLGADHDPMWTRYGGLDGDTAECKAFQVKNRLRFSRSPPETQSMNAAENRMLLQKHSKLVRDVS